MERLGLPSRLPAELVEPGTIIGPLLPGVSSFDALAGTPGDRLRIARYRLGGRGDPARETIRRF